MMSWQGWADKSEWIHLLVFLSSSLYKSACDLLVFCSLQRESPKYFWWNYFLNNLSLLDGLLKLVCLLMVHSYFIMIIDPQNVDAFSDDMFFNNSFNIASHGAPINYFFWTSSFLFLQTFLLINSISLCFDLWIFCHLLAS